jgi:hypothetical protein
VEAHSWSVTILCEDNVEVTEKHIEALELFNEKADKLLDSAFVGALVSGKTEATISGRRQENGSFEITPVLRGPSPEAVDAFVLTFRFFIQDNETTSLRSIATIYEEIGDDDEFLPEIQFCSQCHQSTP